MRIHIPRRERPPAPEAGFTLVEAVVAVFLAAVILLGLALTTMAGYRSLREARSFQQATALANEAVETAREADYDGLVIGDSSLAADPDVTTVPCTGLAGPGYFFDPDGAGSLSCEKVVSGSGGGNHVSTETLNGQTFTVSRYVTWADADPLDGQAAQDYKRVVAVVEWDTGASVKSSRASTLVAEAGRGLPEPNFDLTPTSQFLEVERGNRVTFAHSILNLGVTDTFDLDMPAPPGRNWDIVLYKDLGQVGVYDDGIDVPLTDTDGDGVVDTGSIQPSTTTHFLASWVLPATGAAGLTDITLTATSSADSSVGKTATDTLKVKLPGITLYLHNNPTPPVGNTNAIKDLAMNTTAPTASTLYQYSNNLYSSYSGRFVDKSSVTHSSGSTTTMVNWVYQINTNTTFDGTGSLEIYNALKDLKCDKTVRFTVWVRDRAVLTSDSGTLIATGTGSNTTPGNEPCNFRKTTVDFTIDNYTVITSHYLELKIRIDTSTGDAGLFAYDTSAYNSQVTLPQVSL